MTPPSSTDLISVQETAAQAAAAPVDKLAACVIKMVDAFARLYPNAPEVRKVTVRVMHKQIIIGFAEELGTQMPNDILSECKTQAMNIVHAGHDIRDAFPDCALPFCASFYPEKFVGKSGGFYKIDRMKATMAGLPFSVNMMSKLMIIQGEAAPTQNAVYDIYNAKTGEITHSVDADSDMEAYLKAAALQMSPRDLEGFIETRTLSEHQASKFAALHVSARAPNLLKAFDLPQPVKALSA